MGVRGGFGNVNGVLPNETVLQSHVNV